jgi:hypothetical protein
MIPPILGNIFIVLDLLMQRNGQKRDKKKSKGKNDRIIFPNFFGKKFLAWAFPKKFFLGVFELPC